jgi:gluconolactonase
MYAAPAELRTTIFAHVPDTRLLEGPSFDRHGNLFIVDTPNGQVFRIAPDGQVVRVAKYDGEPSGLKIHQDGRILIADHTRGLLLLDPDTGSVKVLLERAFHEWFKGLNDLVFDRNGVLYFTDQGESDLREATGRLFRWHSGGALECLLDNVPSPNGLVLTPDEEILYLAVTRDNAVWRVPLKPLAHLGVGRLGIGRVGIWIQLSGGVGPDGMAMDVAGRISIAHPGAGSVWVFDKAGEPVYRIRCCEGMRPTNVAFGGPERRTLFITEADSCSVQCVELDIPGREMYSHTD